jgi:5-methyltetrahydrofolate--homocysteine methyltransferase
LSSLLEKIEKSFAEIEPMDQVKRNIETALAENIPALEIMRSMRNGLAEAGRKYEQGKFFLSELIMGGLLAQEVANILKPHLLRSDNHPLCKVVICTVKGDVHDLGKNLVSMMLSSAGFQIIDLGVDVPSEKFVETVRKEKPTIAMSCLLTSAMDEMKNTMSLMDETEFRRNVKILVGGRPVTLNYSKEIGADGYGEDAIDALNIAKSLINDKGV